MPVPRAAALHTLRLAAMRAAVGLPHVWAPWGSRAWCFLAQAPWACWPAYACHYAWLCMKQAPGHPSPRHNRQYCPFLLPHSAMFCCSACRTNPVLKAGKSQGHLTLPQACFKCQWLLLYRSFHHLLLHVHHLTLPKCRTEIFADHVRFCISISSIFLS